MIRSLSLILIFISSPVWAQEPSSSAYTFQAWKEQQVLEAQNQVLRSTNHLNVLRSGHADRGGEKDLPKLPNGRIRKSEDSVVQAERDLKRAQESQQAANGLQFEDYISIYLPTLQDQPEALGKLIEKLSKEELIEVVKSFVLKPGKPSDAKHNSSSVAESLSDGSRSKSLSSPFPQ